MKWKVLLALVIVVMFVMPIMPTNARMWKRGPRVWDIEPTMHGDIILAECNGGLRSWDHAAIWDNTHHKIIEADPHMENWENNTYNGKKWGDLYPFNIAILQMLHDTSYHGNTRYGCVEKDSITDIWFNYSGWAYLRVKNTTPQQRDKAVKYAEKRASHIWPVQGDATRNHPRPFDYKSPWIRHTKQMDTWNDPQQVKSWMTKKLAYGYYCSELVWAAWKHAIKKNLDPNGGTVWPADLERSKYTSGPYHEKWK